MATSTHGRRDIAGSILGILVFLGGVALLVITFRLAYDLFKVPPSDALNLGHSKVLDPAIVGNSVTVIVLRIVLLLIMGIVGSLVANKGIHLYTHSRGTTVHVEHKEKE